MRYVIALGVAALLIGAGAMFVWWASWYPPSARQEANIHQAFLAKGHDVKVAVQMDVEGPSRSVARWLYDYRWVLVPLTVAMCLGMAAVLQLSNRPPRGISNGRRDP